MLKCEVVDVFADGEIQYAQSERAENDRPFTVLSNRSLAQQDVCELAIDEVTISNQLFSQMQRRVGTAGVVHVVSNVFTRQDHLRCQIAQ